MCNMRPRSMWSGGFLWQILGVQNAEKQSVLNVAIKSRNQVAELPLVENELLLEKKQLIGILER